MAHLEQNSGLLYFANYLGQEEMCCCGPIISLTLVHHEEVHDLLLGGQVHSLGLGFAG